MLELYYEMNGKLESISEIEKIKERIDLNSRNMLLMVVLANEEEFDFLSNYLKLHIITIKSIKSNKHIPKIEVYENYLSTIMYDIQLIKESNSYDITPVGIVLMQNITIVLCRKNLDAYNEILRRLKVSLENSFKDSCSLYYVVLDVLVDSHFTILAALEDTLMFLQDNLLRDGKQDYTEKIMNIRRNVLELRKAFTYEQEVLYRISHDKLLFVCNYVIVYMKDIFHHLEKLNAMLQEYNDWASSLTDAYSAHASSRLNDRLQMLTILQYIFMPLGFLTGWYGMGFKMPEVSFRYSYIIFIISVVAITISVLIYFKRKKML
jgi:magnesium transporter